MSFPSHIDGQTGRQNEALHTTRITKYMWNSARRLGTPHAGEHIAICILSPRTNLRAMLSTLSRFLSTWVKLIPLFRRIESFYKAAEERCITWLEVHSIEETWLGERCMKVHVEVQVGWLSLWLVPRDKSVKACPYSLPNRWTRHSSPNSL